MKRSLLLVSLLSGLVMAGCGGGGTLDGLHIANADGSGDILMPGISRALYLDWR